MKISNKRKNERKRFFYDRFRCFSCGQEGNHFQQNKNFPAGHFTCEQSFQMDELIKGRTIVG